MKPIWHVPALVLAGLLALAAVALTFIFGTHEPWPVVQWTLASASLTFTLGHVAKVRHMTRREVELVVLAGTVFVAFYLVPFGLSAAGLMVLSIVLEARGG